MTEPLVTVLMPVYNAGTYLRLAVLSIVAQTFDDWELLIIDDASTDNAIEGIADIVDPRIRLVRNERNLGLAASLNLGIDLARGEYLARMDQDDVAYPERLAVQVHSLQSNPSLDLVAVRCLAINSDNQLLGVLPFAITHQEICSAPWRGFYMAHPAWMGKVHWFRQHRYATPGPYFCEDQELILRTYRTSQFYTVPEILLAYRLRDRIDWRKSFRTRITLLRLRLNHFFSQRQLHFCVMAFFSFAIGVAKDIFNLRPMNFKLPGIYSYYKIPEDSCERLRWRGVLSLFSRWPEAMNKNIEGIAN